MLYIVYGTEYQKALVKRNELLTVLRMKRPGAEFFTLDTDNFSKSALESLYSSRGLFEQKHVVVLDHLLTDKETKEDVTDAFKKMSASESMFLIFDGLLDAKTASSAKKHAEKIYIFGEEKEKKKEDGTSFQVADAFLSRDRKKAWVFFQKAMRSGIKPEALHGAFFWKIKTTLLAKKTGRWDRFAKDFSERELDETMERLVMMYHKIRSEGGELEDEFEKFLLVN